MARAEIPALIEAAKNQDAALLQQLLEDGANPDERQADGATALHWSTYHEDAIAAALLIDSNADVNASNRLGASPLYLAAKSGNASLLEMLLKAGANPNIAMPMGETPLMTASLSGTAEGVRFLLDAGANVNAREASRDQTALMWAAAQGHVNVARLLINAGADIETRSKTRPRLMYADATNGGAFDQGIMEKLGGFSALLFAAKNGNLEIARLLINAEADLETTAGNGASPLVVAVHSGHGSLARLLLEHGADANSMAAGYSALHAAILRGDLQTVNALLDHDADPNARLLRPTPVQRASEEWVLKTPLVGATAFWIAANFREAEIMKALAAKGADPFLTSEEKLSRPRERADRESYTARTIGGLESTVQSAIKGDSTRGRFYIQPNEDPAGEEQLALAAVITAAELGVDLNHRDFTQSSALHDAAVRNLPHIVRELVRRGADIDALNGRGQTPLDLAKAAESRPVFPPTDKTIPGPNAREVLQEFGAQASE